MHARKEQNSCVGGRVVVGGAGGGGRGWRWVIRSWLVFVQEVVQNYTGTRATPVVNIIVQQLDVSGRRLTQGGSKAYKESS